MRNDIKFTLMLLMIAATSLNSKSAIAESKRALKTKRLISTIMVRLERFHADCGFYPSTADGLDGLIFAAWKALPASFVEIRKCKSFSKSGYLEDLLVQGQFPKDAFGCHLLYVGPEHSHVRGKYEVVSLGADCKPGGDGENSDISSNDLMAAP